MHVLILSQRLPYAPNRGDRLRVYHMLREIASRATVDVAALVHDEEEEAHASELSGLATEVVTARVPRLRNWLRAGPTLLGPTPLTHVLLDSPALRPALERLVRRRRPDVILAFCSSMVRFALTPPLADVPCVLDMIDADSAKWNSLASVSAPPKRWIYRREARLLGAFEALAVRTVSATLVVNEKERAALAAVAPKGRILVMENGVDLSAFTPLEAPKPSSTVVFCGVMNYGPNVDGAIWLAKEVWPHVRAGQPEARLTLVGATPSADVRGLAVGDSSILVTGSVDDVRPYLWGAAVAAAPLQVARGVQNKVLEAVAAGLPCVVTEPVAEGLPPEITPACRVGRTPRAFADALLQVLAHTPAERRSIAASANLEPLRWPARLRELLPLLETAARVGTSPTPQTP